MNNMRILQYTHRPNSTELPLGNVHETYMRIDNETNLDEMFPNGLEVYAIDANGNKKYPLKAVITKANSEKRINQLGALYRDYNVCPGDEIILTKIISDEEENLFFNVINKKGVVFTISKDGIGTIDNIERLSGYKIINNNEYRIKIASTSNPNSTSELSVVFKEAKKKRSDSPDLTDFYYFAIDGKPLYAGAHLLIFSNKNYLTSLRKSEFTEINIGSTENIKRENLPTTNQTIIGRNVIYYGVPGAGKSYTIEQDYKINDDSTVVQRVVFHPDYTYSDFVGQIMPKVETEKDTENNTSFSRVSYEFKPGPFTNILRLANENPNKQHILIIEEINRGNAPAIFGDLFQLLDRKEDGSSRYSINNSDISNAVYLDNFPEKKVYLPSNLTIVATMNTSDQNVFTLDTAFQRRWEMRLIENKFRSDHTFADKDILDTKVTWRTFCETMNSVIVGNGARTTSTEDKRLGVYFVKAQDIDFGDGSINQRRKFPEKVIKYLWDDAFKFNREDLFKTNYHSLEDVINDFMEKTGSERFDIFKADIINKLNLVKETKQENTETPNEPNQQ